MTHAEPRRAARTTAASLLAANQIGGWGRCTGRSIMRARVRWKKRPWWVTSSPDQSRVMTSRLSTRRPTRSLGAMPNASFSSSR